MGLGVKTSGSCGVHVSDWARMAAEADYTFGERSLRRAERERTRSGEISGDALGGLSGEGGPA